METEKKEVEGKIIYCPTEVVSFKKSNSVIGAFYNVNLLEMKLINFGLCKLKDIDYTIDKNASTVAELTAKEIKQRLGYSGNSLYNRLNRSAIKMSGLVIGMNDPDQKKFDYFPMITRCKYEKGIFHIEFSHHLKPYIGDMANKFAPIGLDMQWQFESIEAIRLYEELLSKSWVPKGVKKPDIYRIDEPLSMLRFITGSVDASEDAIVEVLNKRRPDYDKACEVAKKVKYPVWERFKTCVLEKAVKEINELTDIEIIEYEGFSTGKKGKTIDVVRFDVRFKNDIKTDDNIIDDVEYNITDIEFDKEEVIDYLYELFAGSVKMKELKKIAEEGKYNIKRITNAKNYVDTRKGKIENYVGYIIETIRNDYSDANNISIQNKKSTFCDFKQHDYNFEEIEKAILESQFKQEVIELN